MIATSNRNYMIRVFKLDVENFANMECLKMFKTPQQLTVELAFDATSRFLACGTTDSHIKVFDVRNGFQTHNFVNPRGVITKLSFIPGSSDTLRLLSTAEDMAVRVWDLVLKKEIGTMKPKGVDNNKASATTCFAFTNDRKTIITGGRDGCLHFWNAMDNYKLI